MRVGNNLAKAADKIMVPQTNNMFAAGSWQSYCRRGKRERERKRKREAEIC